MALAIAIGWVSPDKHYSIVSKQVTFGVFSVSVQITALDNNPTTYNPKVV